MKKVILSAVAALAALSAFAQADSAAVESPKYKAGANRFGVECGISLTDGFSVKGGRVNGIYSINEEWSIRCGLGLSVDKVYTHKDNVDELAGIEGESIVKDYTMTTELSVLPGIQYNFKGTERLEPYVGVELEAGFEKERSKTKTNVTLDGEDKTDLVEKTIDTKAIEFGVGAFTGFDFYMCKDLFIGIELGFGFTTKLDPFQKNYVDDAIDADNNVDTHSRKDDPNGDELTYKNHGHRTVVDINFNPMIRLGWKF